MRSVVVFLAVAVVGAALGVAGAEIKPSECSEGEVRAAPGNDLFQGCVPVELAEKQLER